MREDEARLWRFALQRHDLPVSKYRPFMDDPMVDIHTKRVDYLLEKWTGKGWWDSGVTLRSGWLTPAGVTRAKEVSDAH